MDKNKRHQKTQHRYGMNVVGLLGLAAMTFGLTACYRSIPSNFYTLTPAIQPMVSSNIKLIEVIPIGLPARLNTSLMVIQNPDGKTYQLDNERWSSMLSNELQNAISTGLQQKLGAIDVYNTGLTGGQVVYTVATEFSRFDIVKQPQQTNIEVIAAWVVKPRYPQKSLNALNQIQQLNCRMTFQKVISEDHNNYLKIVQNYQASVQDVTTAIAQSILSVDQKQPVKMDHVVCT